MVRALADGTTFVIGSRYLGRGGVEEGWGVYRWLNSKIATLLARPLTPVSDPLGGYFAVPRGVFSRAGELSPLGYKIALEVLVRSRPRGSRRFRSTSATGSSARASFARYSSSTSDTSGGCTCSSSLPVAAGQFLVVGGLEVVVDMPCTMRSSSLPA